MVSEGLHESEGFLESQEGMRRVRDSISEEVPRQINEVFEKIN